MKFINYDFFKSSSSAWEFGKICLYICLILSGLLAGAVFDESIRLRVSYVAFLGLSLLLLLFVILGFISFRRARRLGGSFFDPKNNGIDGKKYSFRWYRKGKLLNFFPLRVLVVAIVLAVFFLLGRYITASFFIEIFPSLPPLLQSKSVHILGASFVGAIIGFPETKYFWSRFIDLGSDDASPGPISIGIVIGYISHLYAPNIALSF